MYSHYSYHHAGEEFTHIILPLLNLMMLNSNVCMYKSQSDIENHSKSKSKQFSHRYTYFVMLEQQFTSIRYAKHEISKWVAEPTDPLSS